MSDFLTDSIAEYEKDDELYFRECLTIRDHDTSKLLPFVMNKGQRILHTVIEKQRKEKGRVRVLLLKSRRFGGSTYTEARYYKKTSMNFNKNTFIVGHEEKSTNTLFSMAKLFQEQNILAPSTLKSNAQELKFDTKDGKGLKSEYQLATAKNTSAGRSQGIHYLHISEEAFWPNNARELLLGLFQCVPDPPAESEIVRESTANGYGNTFQEQIFKSFNDGRYPYYSEGLTYAWSSPDSDWVVVFIPWFAIEKYTMEIPVHEEEDFISSIDEKVFDKDDLRWVDSEEKTLQAKFNLSYEQLYWRKWAIENKCDGSVDKFHQEYPATVIEAFLSKGSNVFTKQLCDELEEQVSEPIVIGDIYTSTGKSRIKRNKHGNLTVWEHVNSTDSYFITVDVAGGLDPSELKTDREPDKTNIDVWNHKTGNQAAQWNGHIDYDMVSDLVEMIGDLYAIKSGNKLEFPMACVELNNQGHAVVALLEKDGYPQYRNENKKLGWQTNKRTKPAMVTEFLRSMRESTLQINSIGTISEMRTYIEEGKKYNAAPGCNDDRVITGCIAASVIDEIPKKYKSSKSGNVGFNNLEKTKYEDSYQEYYV